MTNVQTTAQLETILEELQGRERASTALAESAADVRQRLSFDATQGDAVAIRSLRKAEADARMAADELKRIEIAKAEARRRLTAARAREAGERFEASKREFVEAGERLLKQNEKLLSALATLGKEIDKRTGLVEELLAIDREAKQLGPTQIILLQSPELLSDALASVLGQRLGRHLNRYAPTNAAVLFREADLRSLGRSVPERERTPLEKAFEGLNRPIPVAWPKKTGSTILAAG